MSQAFKSKYDQLQENELTSNAYTSKANSTDTAERYDSEAHARNICFVQPDGRRVFLNYGYLISGDFEPSENTIVLTFTSHVVTLAGENLEPLFYDLMQYMPKQLLVSSKRYNQLTNDPVVNNMNIEKKG